MKTLKSCVIYGIILILFTACGSNEERHADTIQVYGAVIDSEDAPTENITTVVFLDNVEIGRYLSTPFNTAAFNCSSNPPQSNRIGPGCNNLEFTIPRVAEFNQNGSNITINLRNIKIGETKTFRSVDGRFLVFQTFETPPVRSLLLLQADDTVITPLPGTVVLSPAFSARPSPTANPAATATPLPSNSTPSNSSDSLWTDWIRPFIISAIIGIVVAGVMYALLTKKKTNIDNIPRKVDTATRSRKDSSSSTDPSALVASIVTGTISAILAVIVQKILGL